MINILLILILLGLVFYGIRRYVLAAPDPKSQNHRRNLMLLGVGVFLFLLLVGRSGVLLPLLGAVLAVLARLAPVMLQILIDRAPGWYRNRSASNAPPGAGDNRSSVRTRFLSMMLDHATGAISGVILAGRFEGRRLDSLDLSQLRPLYREYLTLDAESARLLEAYLDKVYGEWARDDGWEDAQEQRQTGGRSGMSEAEALEVLGLQQGCSRQDIVNAHRRLIQKLHPDRGGSDYLAAKINQAKDILLGLR